MAMHNYQQKYGCFPPAYTVDEHGQRMHSWRVLILGFMEVDQGKEKYDFSKPWDSPRNLAFAKESPAFKAFLCPNESERAEQRHTSYVMFVGPRAISDGPTSRKWADITDKPSETIVACEMSRSGILWTEPRDLLVEEMSDKINDPNQIGVRSEHSNGANVTYANGAVRFLSASSPTDKFLKALTTIDGGEDVGEYHRQY